MIARAKVTTAEGLYRVLTWFTIAGLPLVAPTNVIGGIALLVAFEGIAIAVLSLGQDRWSILQASRHGLNSYDRDATRLILGFAVIASIPSAALANTLAVEPSSILLDPVGYLLLAGVALTAVWRVRVAELRGAGLDSDFLASKTVQAGLRLACLWTLLIVLGSSTVYRAQLYFVIASLTGASAGLYLARKRPSRQQNTSPTLHSLARSIQFGSPLVFHGLAVTGLALADRLIVGWLAGLEEVGIYTIGYSLASALVFGHALVAMTKEPAMIRATSQGDPQRALATYSADLRRTSAILIGPALALAWAVGTISDAPRDHILAVFFLAAAAHMLWLPYLLANPIVIASNRPSLLARSTGMALILNVFLNLLLVPFLGAVGAAIATILGYGFLSAHAYGAARRLTLIGRLPARDRAFIGVGTASLSCAGALAWAVHLLG